MRVLLFVGICFAAIAGTVVFLTQPFSVEAKLCKRLVKFGAIRADQVRDCAASPATMEAAAGHWAEQRAEMAVKYLTRAKQRLEVSLRASMLVDRVGYPSIPKGVELVGFPGVTPTSKGLNAFLVSLNHVTISPPNEAEDRRDWTLMGIRKDTNTLEEISLAGMAPVNLEDLRAGCRYAEASGSGCEVNAFVRLFDEPESPLGGRFVATGLTVDLPQVGALAHALKTMALDRNGI